MEQEQKLKCLHGIDNGVEVTEGQKLKYKIKVSNTGELPVENVVVRNQIPNGTTYIEETVVKNDIETFNRYTYYSSSNELRWEIGTIESGQIAELEYTVVIDDYPSILEYYGSQEGFTEEEGRYYIISTNEETGEVVKTEITDLPDIEIENKAILEASNIEKEIYSNELKNKVTKSYFNIIEESSVQKAVFIEENQDYTYTVIVENKTDLQMKNLEITKIIPEGVTYKAAEIMQGSGNIIIDDTGKKLIIKSDNFESHGIMEINIKVTANKLPDGVYKKEIITNVEVKAEGITPNISSSISNTVGKPKITSSIDCDVKQRYVYEKDIINYTITVQNENDMTLSNLNLTNIIPEGTKFISGSYTQNGNEYSILSDGSREITIQTNLKQETIIVKIKVEIEKITTNVEEQEIINKATIKANNLEEQEIGQIKHIVINKGENPSQGGEDKPQGGETGEDGIIRYKIKGSVWNDVNKNGEREDNEDVISGVKVYLIKENGEVVKDYKTGEEKIAVTDLDGEYEFRNVEQGKYMVIFMYDSSIYNITEYQKEGVVNDRNSDAILKTIYFEGENREAGVTDIIEITDREMYSIDMGLMEKPKFNLKLEAGISKITVKTKKETKEYNYDMANLAKTEIRAGQLNGATVIIEYNLKITNNSDMPGSVTQIMANKANGLTFSSAANKDWYEGNDKNLYISALSNQIIMPGETINTKLILLKQMTNNNVGKVENKFTITKIYNEKGVEESSIEDNSSVVTVLITISTGTAITYTGISIIILSIFSMGVYITRRKLSIEKRWK